MNEIERKILNTALINVFFGLRRQGKTDFETCPVYLLPAGYKHLWSCNECKTLIDKHTKSIFDKICPCRIVDIKIIEKELTDKIESLNKKTL